MFCSIYVVFYRICDREGILPPPSFVNGWQHNSKSLMSHNTDEWERMNDENGDDDDWC